MSPKRFAERLCVLCHQHQASPVGEHAWPSWLLREFFPPEAGPYTVERRKPGEPSQKVWQGGSMNRVKVPCCVFCNRELNRRFEQNPRHIVERLLRLDDLKFDAHEVELLGLWFVKTMLLLSHPDAVNSSTTIPGERWSPSELPNIDLYSWLVDDEPPPPCLSVWLSRVDPEISARQDKPVMFLPTVVADGRLARFMVRRQVLRAWEITLLCHPGWPVTHPLDTAGEVVRLWPSPGQSWDLTNLPTIEPFAVQWCDGPNLWFAPGTYQSHTLPPLSDIYSDLHMSGIVYASI